MKGFQRAIGLAVVAVTLGASAAFAQDDMTKMPQAHEKQVFTVKSADQAQDLVDQRGFGDQASSVRMMNLMMVEGSSMQGMRMDGAAGSMSSMKSMSSMSSMPGMKAQPEGAYTLTATIAPNPPKVGANQVRVTVRDRRTHAPAKGLKLQAKVYMTIMDMGTDTPRVKEVAPGTYALTANFAMKGPWAVKLLLPKGQAKVFVFTAK